MKEASAMVGLSPTTFWSLAQPQQWPTMYFAERDPHKPRHDFVDLGVTGVIGPNLAKAKILAKYNTVNQSDRLPGGTKPAHAVRE
jgi:hypothetical protein